MLVALGAFSTPLLAQSDSSPNYVLISVVAVVAIFGFGALLSLSDNLLKLEGNKYDATKKGDIGLFPSLSNLFKKKAPKFVGENPFHSFSSGHNILLKGKAEDFLGDRIPTRFALKPTDFRVMSPIPKVEVTVGQEVKAGDSVYYDKKRPEIKYVSPVSGEVVEINRGAKRSIANIVILADKEQQYAQLNAPDLDAGRDAIREFLIQSGFWPMINERPFDIVPNIDSAPDDIFISTFDTAPLAPDLNLVLVGKEAAFQKGLDVLAQLTDGKVHLGLSGNKTNPPADVYANAQNVVKSYYAGAHPAGNVGVQIHNTAPIVGDRKVWTLNVQDVAAIGEAFISGRYDGSRVVAVTGNEFRSPGYIRTYQGANISELVGSELVDQPRLIEGDVLSGKETHIDDYLGFNVDQITSIKEGDQYELFGWLLPLKPRPTISGTFPNFLYPELEFEANTNTHGEQRAFVVSGQYESVLPMNIYPMHLMKAIMANDFERMEGLGIKELSEEDVALCEFVCTSKAPLQQTLRQGLDEVRSQL